MRTLRPPLLATWLLDHVRLGRANESLMGDLVEEYGSGRSRAWYWRQVLMAIGVFFCKEISTHRLLAIKALITGWAAAFLFRFVVLGVLSRFHLWLPLYSELPRFVGKGVANALTWLILWAPMWVGSGWFMSRLYRSHLASVMLVFSTSVLVWNLHRLPWTVHLLFEAADNARYFSQFAVELMNLTLPPACIALGGLMASRGKPELPCVAVWSSRRLTPNG